jgi:hypothetical protein
MRHVTAVALLLAVAVACSDPYPAGSTVRVLFVGNSLTSTNDLPGLVRSLAQAGGAVAIETRDVSQGGYSIEDHWATAESRDALAEGGWDVVVLQQGPSALPESRVNLIEWAGTWADAIRAQGGTPALYMVWPERARLSAFDSVSTSYRRAAQQADARLYPAGDAWQAAWRRDPTLALYGPDDFHPSVMGSYLAALVIYRGITGRDPPSLTNLGISAQAEATLQAAARDVAGVITARLTDRPHRPGLPPALRGRISYSRGGSAPSR